VKPDFSGREGRTRAKLVRATLLLAVALAAWAGYFAQGLSRPWMMAFAALGSLAMLVMGAVVAGLLYHDEHRKAMGQLEEMRGFSESTLARMALDLENLEKAGKDTRRDLCMASVVMAKHVSERVAARLIKLYSGNLPNDEHRTAAVRDAKEIVAQEVLAYGESLMAPKKS
jgi:hypothetical protein